MKVTIIEGPETEERIQRVYQYIARMVKKELQDALKEGKTEEEFWNEIKEKSK